MTRTWSIDEHQRASLGAVALIGIGAFLLFHQVFALAGEWCVLAVGLACFGAYLFLPRFSGLIVPGGFLTGLGIGVLLVSTLVPDNAHGAVILASMALGFGLIAFFGEAYHQWARVAAIFFAGLSAFVFLVSTPGFIGPWWPLVLIVIGLWIMRRDRRWA